MNLPVFGGYCEDGSPAYRRLTHPFLNKDRLTGLYRCHLCPYRTIYRSSIRSHFAIHSSDRPYGCDNCQYKAKRSSDLRKHKLLKHGKKVKSRRSAAYAGADGMNETSGGSFQFQHVVRQTSSGSAGQEYVSSGDVGLDNLLADGNSTAPVFPQGELEVSMEAILGQEAMGAGHPHVVVKQEPQDQHIGHESGEVEVAGSYSGLHGQDAWCKASMEPCRFPDNSSSGVFTTPPPTMSQAHRSYQSANCTVQEQSSPRDSTTPKSYQLANYAVQAQSTTDTPVESPSCSRQPGHQRSPASASVTLTSSERSRPRSVDECSLNSASLPTSSETKSACTDGRKTFLCSFCNILFFDPAIYFMHKGLHDPVDPWRCNLCGTALHDVYSFTSHFINGHNATA